MIDVMRVRFTMKNSGVGYFFALCALFALISCTREAAGAQAVEENLSAQDNVVLPAEILESNFTAEIYDINGTWVTEWSYNALLGMAEEERKRHIIGLDFTWGEGKRLIHAESVIDRERATRIPLTTVAIDLIAEIPFVSAGSSGPFLATNITQVGLDIIKVNTIRRQPDFPEGGWVAEFIFRFIDRDTIRIESDEIFQFREGGGVLWRRLSGPDWQQENVVFTVERPESNFVAEINGLNGTWMPEWTYHATEEQREGWRSAFRQEFSWGEGKSRIYQTFDIDVTAENPFVFEPVEGWFFTTNIAQTGINSIKVNAVHHMRDNDAIELVFHFIDRDTFWIETHDFRGLMYERGVFWHRVSGPER